MTPLSLPSLRESVQNILSGEGLNDATVVVSVRGEDRLHWVPEELVEHESPGVLELMANVVRVTLTVLRIR
jgi:hypothetical protein